MRTTLVIGAALAAIAFLTPDAQALREKTTWDTQTREEPDAQAGGWFINLGITGARGKLEPTAPTVMQVAFVFKGTPAYGKLKVGDRIIGANGKAFKTPHKFGYGMDKFGYEGPMMDIGNALEESQGPKLNGKLTFTVKRGSETKDIELNIGTKYGQFSKNFPFDCKKTDKILDDVYAYLLKRQRSNGTWSRLHINTFAALALLSSGKPEHKAAAKRAMQQFARETGPKVPQGGLQNWRYSLYGVALAEYYLATGERWVLPELAEIRDALLGSQFMAGGVKEHGGRQVKKSPGGWGHNTGFEGYGPICMITAQAKTALGLMQQCGLEVPEKNYKAAHEFLKRGTNKIGYVWYADGGAGNSRYADMGRTGGSAVAHFVSSTGGKAYQDYAMLSARCIGTNYNTFPDTHASPLLGVAWTALGASVDPASFRNLMDQHKWFFNLSQNPDGTFYYQPNRDNNPQDYTAGPRISATGVMALVFSIKHKSLRVMGAKVFIEGVNPMRLSANTKKPFDLIVSERFGTAHGLLVKAQAKLKGTTAPPTPTPKTTAPKKSPNDLVDDRTRLIASLGKKRAPARKPKTTARASRSGGAVVVKVSPEEDLATVEAMLKHIDKQLQGAIAALEAGKEDPDAAKVYALLNESKTQWAGIPAFEAVAEPLAESFKTDPRKSALKQGQEYQRILARAQAKPSRTNIRSLERFVTRYKDSYYAKLATAAAQRLSAQ